MEAADRPICQPATVSTWGPGDAMDHTPPGPLGRRLCCQGGRGKQGTNQVTCCAVHLDKGEEGSDGDAGPHAQVCSATASSICNDKRVSGFLWRTGVVGSRGAGEGRQRLRWMGGWMDGWMDAGQQTTYTCTPAVWSKYSLVSFPASSATPRRRTKKQLTWFLTGSCSIPLPPSFVPRHRQQRQPQGGHFSYSELHHSRSCSQSALLVTGRGGNIRPG